MPGTTSDYERRKAQADAEAAEIARDQAQLELEKAREELEEWRSASSVAARDAERRAKVLANEATERDAIKDLIPDLTKVAVGKTAIGEDQVLFGALLAGEALSAAAVKVSRAVKAELGDNFRVLVTTDSGLASRDASFLVVRDQLAAIRISLDEYLGEGARAEDAVTGLALPQAVAVAAAQLIPGLISLFSSSRALTAKAGTLDDLTASIAVAGQLAASDRGASIVLDDIRLLPEVEILDDFKAVLAARLALKTRLGELAGSTSDEDVALRKRGTALAEQCDAAITALVTPAEGSTRSPLAAAALQQSLRTNGRHVLVVKGGATSIDQLLKDRTVGVDTFGVQSAANIAFVLIDVKDGSKVRAGGVVTGTASQSGRVDDMANKRK